ncbi:MAG: OmpH family outer membrane protein [Candidatus Sumerlaeota bacterium]|nr:OmpH family outer membrane protein [Candidatus Sumerlaeota bacterium]
MHINRISCQPLCAWLAAIMLLAGLAAGAAGETAAGAQPGGAVQPGATPKAKPRGAPAVAEASAAPEPVRNTANLKVGFVDFDRVVKESKYIKGMVATLNTEARLYQEKIDAGTGKYERLARQLAEQKSVLTQQQQDERLDELKKLKSDIEDLRYTLDKMLRDSRDKSLNPALEKAVQAVEKIGRTEGYDLILNGESVLYAIKTINLTDRVIEDLDKSTASGETKKPEAGGDTKKPAIDK